jgi:carbonic anhydrase
MSTSITEELLLNNRRYAAGESLHSARHPGALPIKPSRRVVVLGCMDARLDIEDLLGLQTGEAHIVRNAGGVASEDAVRSLLISHHLLDTKEIIVIQHTRCGMLAFTDDLLRSALEGDEASGTLVSQATAREFVCRSVASSSPAAFHAFRGDPEPLDSPPDATNHARLTASVRRTLSAIQSHPWIPFEGSDAVSVRGFIYDVDTGLLHEVKP